MVVADGLVHNCSIYNDVVQLVYIRSEQRNLTTTTVGVLDCSTILLGLHLTDPCARL